MIDRTEIERLVPHAGAMCLLDAVTSWGPTSITCVSRAPTAAHPLARDGMVPTIVAAEYAAQATAVHGALLEPRERPPAGLLASLVDVHLSGASLPPLPLGIEATMQSRSSTGCLYTFVVSADSEQVATGRLMVAL